MHSGKGEVSHILSHKLHYMPYVITRNNRKHFKRRIPKLYQGLYPKKVKFVQVSLKTDSETIAQQRALQFNQLLEELWRNSAPSTNEDAIPCIEKLSLIANAHGLDYKNTNEIAKGDLVDAINRLIPLKNEHYDSSSTVAALLGKDDCPALPISKALETYFELEQPNLYNKSDDQVRKWKNPRKRAVNNFITVCGDLDILNISREDVLKLKAWWSERIQGAEKLSGNAANKDFTHLKCILRTLEDNQYGISNTDELFRRIRFPQVKSRRPPFSADFIQSQLLNLSNLNGLNEECRWFIFAMADTGARPSELVGLDVSNGDIRLDTDIPYISIRPDHQKALKTAQSERVIPLVGASLEAFKNLPNGFQNYYRKSDTLSNTLNKYLRDNDLLPTEAHCLYSLRHSFEDRLTAVEPPDKLQAALMGHKYNRPRYGDGPSLVQKQKWLERIAFHVA